MLPRANYTIRDLHQIAALASPVCQDIVDALVASGPCTVAELARRLGRPPDALYHHVRRLIRQRLVVARPGSRGAGRPAARLDVPGRLMTIGYDLGSRTHAATMDRVVGAMLRSAHRNFVRAFAPRLSRSTGKRRNLWAGRRQGWLRARDLEEANALVARLVQLLGTAATRRSPGSALHEFTFVLAPVAPTGRRAVAADA